MLQEKIRRYRAEKGMSQEQFAQEIGVVRQTVSKWEKGLSVPDAEMLVKISETLNVPVSELISENSGERKDNPENKTATQLELLNKHLEIREHGLRSLFKIIGFIVLAVIIIILFIIIFFTVQP